MISEDKKEVAERLKELVALLEYPTPEVAERCDLELEDLESRYVRLFVNDLGGVAAPPYAGCYLVGSDRLKFMSEFSGFCLKHGLALDPAQPPDYIPMMVEVLAMLLSGNDRPEIPQLLITSYYQQWPEAFAATLKQSDDIGIYVTVAEEFCRLLQEVAEK
ncbi:molecular chaperone TorD family protein [Pelovirga terrestris]|uniref:Molecular chaperone TorD family protein n=1 Tax=Pelovirga terrestris TaxID=2771352 RepID=A0A8J6UGM9_9BACT|nr:molecular chaperone TorD family protein [Pelovirga terrestris]